MKPLITVGLTCFNASDSIERAIESALHQDWDNLEIIIVDDCSTDNSWRLLKNILKRDPRIRVFRRDTNGGPAASRNTILENALGEFVCFFDDDDESLPERVSLQFKSIVEYESRCDAPILCYASGSRRYNNGYELAIEAIGSKPIFPVGEVLADYLLFNGRRKDVFYGGGTPTCALMARKKVLEEVGGFDPNLRRVEDVDLAIRVALLGGHFVGCPEKLYLQYATTGLDKTSEKNLEAELALLEKHRSYLMKKKRYLYAKSWFRIRYYHFSGQRLKFILSLALLFAQYPLVVSKHLLQSAPNRIKHELKMSK